MGGGWPRLSSNPHQSKRKKCGHPGPRGGGGAGSERDGVVNADKYEVPRLYIMVEILRTSGGGGVPLYLNGVFTFGRKKMPFLQKSKTSNFYQKYPKYNMKIHRICIEIGIILEDLHKKHFQNISAISHLNLLCLIMGFIFFCVGRRGFIVGPKFNDPKGGALYLWRVHKREGGGWLGKNNWSSPHPRAIAWVGFLARRYQSELRMEIQHQPYAGRDGKKRGGVVRGPPLDGGDVRPDNFPLTIVLTPPSGIQSWQRLSRWFVSLLEYISDCSAVSNCWLYCVLFDLAFAVSYDCVFLVFRLMHCGLGWTFFKFYFRRKTMPR